MSIKSNHIMRKSESYGCGASSAVGDLEDAFTNPNKPIVATKQTHTS